MIRKTQMIALLSVWSLSGCHTKTEEANAQSPTVQPTAEPTVSEEAPEEAPAAQPEDAPAAILVIEAAKLSLAGKKGRQLALEPSGEIKADGKLVGKLSPDGKATDADGKETATITADGKVTFAGELESLEIAEDGTTKRGGKEVAAIGADGVVTGALAKEMGAEMTYEGPPAARRAMMFAYLTASMRPMK